MPIIALEGIDGSGKSTQAKMLNEFLMTMKYPVKMIREPGGTYLGEKIRNIVVEQNDNDIYISPHAELFLFLASRAQLITEDIRPSLKNGDYVICDRFIDSSIAYQGYGRLIGADRVFSLCLQATGGICPDISLFMDISPTGVKDRRSLDEKRLDRIELEDLSFHTSVYEGYKEWMKISPYRIVGIDANHDQDTVFGSILATLTEYNITPKWQQK
jgi:dTMP kinase